MGACRHCGAPFTAEHHPTAAASGNFYCHDGCRTAHIVGVYSPWLDRRMRAERRVGDRRIGDRRAS